MNWRSWCLNTHKLVDFLGVLTEACYIRVRMVFESLGKMSWCLMSSDVNWHIRDKLWPMLKHGSINLHPRKPEGSLGRTSQDVHLNSHTTPELWFGENAISFPRPWKSVKTEWCLWKFVNLWSSEKAREKLSAYQSETAFPKTKQ